MDKVQAWYDEKYDEWARLERHKIEFDITKKHLDKYIKGEKLEIFDIGGGPGRYSFYLAEQGHQVTLLDLSKKNIEIAQEKSEELGIQLKQIVQGNALDLSAFQQQFDVILLMGPLYHLLEAADRAKSVSEALRLLKPGGLLVASFISTYAPIQDYLKKLYPFDQAGDLLQFLDDGRSSGGKGFTQAYFIDPYEAMEFLQGFGLKQLAFAGVENILAAKEIEVNELSEEEYEKWLNVCYKLSQDKNLYGTSEHYLYIGQKP